MIHQQLLFFFVLLEKFLDFDHDLTELIDSKLLLNLVLVRKGGTPESNPSQVYELHFIRVLGLVMSMWCIWILLFVLRSVV